MGQNLSIGQGCDYKAIIEHEILHALGFYHEQSRTDRDDYVNIWWDEILPGVYEPKVVGWDLLLPLSLAQINPGMTRPNLCVNRSFSFSRRNTDYDLLSSGLS